MGLPPNPAAKQLRRGAVSPGRQTPHLLCSTVSLAARLTVDVHLSADDAAGLAARQHIHQGGLQGVSVGEQGTQLATNMEALRDVIR